MLSLSPPDKMVQKIIQKMVPKNSPVYVLPYAQRNSTHRSPEEQKAQRTRGTVGTGDQWNSGYRGTVGTKDQWNSGYKGPVEKWVLGTRGLEEQ